MTSVPTNRGERGIALVLAMLVLLSMSLLAVVLMLTVNAERKIAGSSVRVEQARNLAEAGVNEACARLSTDITLATPRSVAQVFLVNPGSVPALGTDSTGFETKQPAGEWLQYSTATRSPDALTIEYRTDAARTAIYKYDASKNPAIQTVSGLPIYRITSTGQKGSAKVKVVTEVMQKPMIANVQAALMAGVPIGMSGNAMVCGWNHRADTPAGTRTRILPNTNGSGCDDWEMGAGDLPGLWSTSTITSGGSSDPQGSPVKTSPGNPTFYAGPWEPLGMTQADYWAWVGSRVGTPPSNPSGIVYIDNDASALNATGNFAYHGGDGHGYMLVDGDLRINGNFTYRGLLYVQGDLDINGTCWILGGVIVKGKTSVNIANGNFTVLYSADAITQNISQGGSQFVNLSWREIH